MCVVFDADTFSEISDSNNDDFEPIRRWIRQDNHKVLYGGTKYKKELEKHSKFRRYLKGLSAIGNAHKLEAIDIDNVEGFLQSRFTSGKYNDHHIVAILLVSGCRVVSSHDNGLHRLIQDCYGTTEISKIRISIYKLRVCKPSIYQNKSHQSLLRQRSVAHCCV